MSSRETGSSGARRLVGAGMLVAALALAIAWGLLRPGREAETGSSRAAPAPGAPAAETEATAPRRALDAMPPLGSDSASATPADRPSLAMLPEPILPAAVPETERRSASSCSLSIRVVDAPGGPALTSFEIERAVWQRGLMEAPSRQWISDPEGRVEYDGLMCESLIGLRVFAAGRPAKLFGPIVTREVAPPLELVVGRAGVLRVVVVDAGRLIQGAAVSVDRPICDGALVYEHAVWPRVPTDETGVAEVTGLVAGRYVVSATGAMRASDLLELDLQAGVVCEKLLVLRDELAPGSLVVTVVDNEGPVPRKRVRLGPGARGAPGGDGEDENDEPGDPGVGSGTTDAEGRCRFDALAPDLYPVTILGAFGPDAHAVVRQRSETRIVVRLID